MSQKPSRAEVIDVRDVPATEPARLGQIDKLVIYSMGPYRRYSVKVPEAEFTEEGVKAAIQRDWDSRKAWIGKQFELSDAAP